MNCERCKLENQCNGNPSSRFTVDGISFKTLRCNSCFMCIGFQMAEGWCSIEQFLKRDSQIDGLYPAITTQDKIVHHILSQILHNENEGNTQHAIFDVPDEQDIVILLWQNGCAVGFYTLKLKGTWIEETGEVYAVTTLDTIFVQAGYRRNGFCQTMLKHICISFADEDIGISKPVSSAMKAALQKFLINNPHLRNKLWEVEGTGGEGCRKLVWLVLAAEKRNLSISPKSNIVLGMG